LLKRPPNLNKSHGSISADELDILKVQAPVSNTGATSYLNKKFREGGMNKIRVRFQRDEVILIHDHLSSALHAI